MDSKIRFYNLMLELESFHSIFYQIVDFGCRPVFVEAKVIPTACIQYKNESLTFMFCKKFFDKLSDEEAKFVICHEMLHVLLNHGKRFRQAIMSKDRRVADKTNKALDIAINESLLDFFNFKREDLTLLESLPLCFINTIFKDTTDILRGQTGEYYYLKMQDEENLKEGAGSGDSLNDHTQFVTMDELLDAIGKGMSSYDKAKLKEAFKEMAQQAGTEEGGLLDVACLHEIKRKVRWEKVIKNWVEITQRKLFPVSNWASEDRRFYDVVRKSGFILPGHREMPTDQKNRIKLFFFLDTSGSCINLADRFFTAAATINQEFFDLHLLNFDTRVYETNLKHKKVYGGGGTYFDILHRYIVSKVNKNDRWAAFVLTDGMGNDPKIPENEQSAYHWFLTHDYKHCIPTKSKVYKLDDFE